MLPLDVQLVQIQVHAYLDHTARHFFHTAVVKRYFVQVGSLGKEWSAKSQT